MAYLRYGSLLPSGEKSTSFVIGDPSGLHSFDKGHMPYGILYSLFETKSDPEIKDEISDKLKLTGEELDVVCEMLFSERDQGKWKRPLE